MPPRSLGEPRARLGLAVFGKNFTGPCEDPAVKASTVLPMAIRRRNLFKVGVAEEKSVSPNPRRVLQKSFPQEKLKPFRSGDFFHELGFAGIELFFQFHHAKAQRCLMLFEIGAHRCIWYLVLEFEEGRFSGAGMRSIRITEKRIRHAETAE